ncbi:serpin B10-like [Scylla paramamosain]|uniref:serpin B10-like n=1 Tax=Scylla paramamosain TaxID=85552 RepID=UPI0030834786
MTEATAAVAMVVVIVLASFTTTTQAPTLAASKSTNTAWPSVQPLRDNVDYNDVNNFGLELMRLLAVRGNVLISPLSLWSSLVLTLYGAELMTQHEMEEILHVLYVRRDELLRFLNSVEGRRRRMRGEPDVLIMEQKTRVFKENEFVLNASPAKELWDRLCSVNFTMPEEAERRIDKFVQETTYNLIPSLVNANQLRGTLMAMETASCFKSDWRFNCRSVCRSAFYPLPYSQPINMTMMWVRQLLPVGMDAQLQATVVRMPFYSWMSLYLILPLYTGEGAFQETLEALDSWTLMHALKNLGCYRIEVHVPRFKMEGDYGNDLIPCLRELGSKFMFDAKKADFSYFADSMYATNLNHRVFVDISEGPTAAGMASNVQLKSSFSSETPQTETSCASSHITAKVEINMPLKKGNRNACRRGRNSNGSSGNSSKAQWIRENDRYCNLCLKFNRPFVFLLVDDVDDIIWQVGVFKSPLN